MPQKQAKKRAEGPTPRQRITEVMRDAKRPIRSLEIWQRLAIEKGQHHPGYLHLSEVRREIRAMYRENRVRLFKGGGSGRQMFWTLKDTPLGEIAEWADLEQRARPPKKEPEPMPDPADDAPYIEPDEDEDGNLIKPPLSPIPTLDIWEGAKATGRW